jgi:hypothetical protein
MDACALCFSATYEGRELVFAQLPPKNCHNMINNPISPHEILSLLVKSNKRTYKQ